MIPETSIRLDVNHVRVQLLNKTYFEVGASLTSVKANINTFTPKI